MLRPLLKSCYVLLTVLPIATFLAGCLGPYTYHRDKLPPTEAPLLKTDHAIMADGYTLPTVTYSSDSPPRAVVLALHGFNDYRNAFVDIGNYLAARDIVLVAYDQRGFGETEGRGYWHGTEALSSDLLTMIRLLNQRYPATPLYLLGESMGGAVIMVSTGALSDKSEVNGIILVAPAVWASRTMPWYQRGPMWFFAHVMPWFYLSSQGMDIMPSDNIEMLRALGRDPLVIKGARSDVVYGLTQLMSEALEASPQVELPALILYGKNDEIVPPEPTCEMLEALPASDSAKWQFILYENGYHMLTRDLGAEKIYDDIVIWLTEPDHVAWEGGVSPEDLEFVCHE